MVKSSLAFYILTSLFSNSAECYKYANWENAAFIDRYVLHFMGFFASKVNTFQKFQNLCKEVFFYLKDLPSGHSRAIKLLRL